MSDLEKELKRLRDERQKKFDQEDWDGALAIHDQILKLSPSALRYANRGSILYRMGRLEDAIESYRQALDMDPSLKRAKADLERLEAQLQKKGKDSGAKDRKPLVASPMPSEPALSDDAETPEVDDKQKKMTDLRDRRQKFIDEGNWAEALKLHNQIIEIEPTALRYATQATMYYRLGKLHDALESCKKALAIDPNLEKAKTDMQKIESQLEEELLLGSSSKGSKGKEEKAMAAQIENLRKDRQKKIDAGDWEGALKLHDEILKLDPSALRYANRGSLLYRMGRLQDALDAYEKAKEMDPSLPKIDEDIRNLKSQLEEEKLITLSDRPSDVPSGSTLSPEERAAKIEQLKVDREKYLDAKNWEKALELQDEMIKLDSTPLRYVNRGSMLYRMGRLEDAIQSYRKALEMDPNIGRAKVDLARMEKEFAEKQAKEKAAGIEKKKAAVAEEIEQLPEKEKLAVQTEKPKPEPAKLTKEEIAEKMEELRQERQRLVAQEKWEDALKVYDKIIELEPSASRYASRGSLLYKVGRINEAILSYREALNVDTEYEEAKEAIETLKESEMERLRTERAHKMDENDWEAALKIHDVMLALEPNAQRYANQGSLLYSLNRQEEAMVAYKKALELDPAYEKAREELTTLEREMAQKPVMALPAEFQEDEEEFFQAEPVGEPGEEISMESKKEVVEDASASKAEKKGCCIATLSGHTSEITALIATFDGKLIISAGKDKTIKVWESETKSCLTTLEGHQDWIRTLSVSTDNSRLISGSDDWTVKIWDIKSGKCEHTLEGHTMPIMAVSISANNRFIFSCGRDHTIKIWDTKSGKCLSTLEGHKDWISCFVLSSDGNKAISGSYDNTIRIWNVLGWRCTNILEGHKGWIKKILLTPDGKQIISAGQDRTIKIWEISSGKCLQTLEGHNDQITDVQISFDGRLLASSGRDQKVLIWDMETYQQKVVLYQDLSRFEKLAITPDNHYIFSATESNKICAWKIEDARPKILEDHTKPITSFHIVKEKNWLVSGSSDNTVKIWDYSLFETA